MIIKINDLGWSYLTTARKNWQFPLLYLNVVSINKSYGWCINFSFTYIKSMKISPSDFIVIKFKESEIIFINLSTCFNIFSLIQPNLFLFYFYDVYTIFSKIISSYGRVWRIYVMINYTIINILLIHGILYLSIFSLPPWPHIILINEWRGSNQD